MCAQLTFNEMLEKEPGEDAPGVSAAFALTHGWANCQGYSDAFYLLAGMAGFEVDSKMDTTPGFCMRGTRWN